MKVIPFLALSLLVTCCNVNHKPEAICECDSLKLKTQKLSQVAVDSTRRVKNFYALDSVSNKQLWFEDIESIDSTQYTRLWDAYHENSFQASHRDFRNHYAESPDTELAFQIGPGGPLWTYFTFVLKKKECCFVFSRTSFTHARFRYKAYAILNRQKVDSLFDFMDALDKRDELDVGNSMTATFIDRRNDEMFDVAVEKFSSDHRSLPPDSAVIKFINFVDTKIKWTETYPLRPEKVLPKLDDNFVISGRYRIESEQGNFKAMVKVDKKETYMYYTLTIVSENGKLLAAESSTIDFDQIGKGSDEFEFVRKHVINEIREYKIRSNKIVVDITETK
jgi:hypothetical protein